MISMHICVNFTCLFMLEGRASPNEDGHCCPICRCHLPSQEVTSHLAKEMHELKTLVHMSSRHSSEDRIVPARSRYEVNLIVCVPGCFTTLAILKRPLAVSKWPNNLSGPFKSSLGFKMAWPFQNHLKKINKAVFLDADLFALDFNNFLYFGLFTGCMLTCK